MAVNPEKRDPQQLPRVPWFRRLAFDVTSSEWDILALSTAFKSLLFPAYRSTDFEVHRNWLAITHSLPISKWYYDVRTALPLDYPPFFAYFEKVLSIPASLIDPRIVDLNNLNYSAWTVVAYQRTTVILTELLLAAVLLKFARGVPDPNTQRLISASLFLHPGFLIVDHIHFQYNGFLFGILLLSILQARQGNLLASGFFFAVLLNFKHIYMYLAPAYFRAPQQFFALANVVILVFIASLGPFLLMGQVPQLLSRLFPFTRGLNHAYWAPNAWAILTATDRVLLQYAKRFGASFSVDASGVSSSSRGLVGDTSFAVLPSVRPIHTFLITISLQMIFLIKLWRIPTYKSFLTALTLCGYTSFMFGWHVHEKAVLLVLVPLSLLAAENYAYFRTFVLASTAWQQVIQVVYSLLWAIVVFGPLQQRLYEFPRSLPAVIVGLLETTYLWGFLFLEIVVTLCPILAKVVTQHPERWEFLPLMLTSLYCAVGLIWAYARLSFLYITMK
ncbi:glycosyltransferase family 57 protein [Lactarius deliciosus]|nr:glycosyltransferase family 57 protein [Lactarius deliciosus]